MYVTNVQTCRVSSSLVWLLKKSHKHFIWPKQHLLVLLEKAGWLKEFGPFCLSLKNFICDAEACSHRKHTHQEMTTNIQSDWQNVEKTHYCLLPDHFENDPEGHKSTVSKRFTEPEQLYHFSGFFFFFCHAVSRTVFELLAHDCACWCGHIVCWVLLGIGRCDDGHQVVSVRWVDLKNKTHNINVNRNQGWIHSRIFHQHFTPYWLHPKSLHFCHISFIWIFL